MGADRRQTANCRKALLVAATLAVLVLPCVLAADSRHLMQATPDGFDESRILRILPVYQFDLDWLKSPLDGDSATREYVTEKLIPKTIAVLQRFLMLKHPRGYAEPLWLGRSCEAEWDTGKCKAISPVGQCIFAKQDPNFFGPYEECPKASDQCTEYEGGAGADTDFVLYITAVQFDQICDGSAGVADACTWDPDTQRPTSGFLNLCPAQLDSSPAAFDDQLAMVVHQALHILLMSDANFEHFVNKWKGPLPQSKFLSEKKVDGKTRRYITSETVIKEARQHYNCDSLTGVELQGENWHPSMMLGDILDPFTVRSSGTVSPITLALAQDSGWYYPVWEHAQPLPFGRLAGCGILDPCAPDQPNAVFSFGFAPTTPQLGQYLCNGKNQFSCVSGGNAIGHCSAGQRQAITSPVPALGNSLTDISNSGPEGCGPTDIFNLYDLTSCEESSSSSSSSSGGASGPSPAFGDCNLYYPHPQLLCHDSTLSANVLNQKLSKTFHQSFGASSHCLPVEDGVLEVSLSSGPSVKLDMGAGCWEMNCDGSKLYVVIDGEKERCKEGQFLDLTDLSAGFTSGRLGPCPEEAMCQASTGSNKCPDGCSGHGMCLAGVCACHLGYIGDDCGQMTCDNTQCAALGLECHPASGSCVNFTPPSPPPSPPPGPPPSPPPPPPPPSPPPPPPPPPPPSPPSPQPPPSPPPPPPPPEPVVLVPGQEAIVEAKVLLSGLTQADDTVLLHERFVAAMSELLGLLEDDIELKEVTHLTRMGSYGRKRSLLQTFSQGVVTGLQMTFRANVGSMDAAAAAAQKLQVASDGPAMRSTLLDNGILVDDALLLAPAETFLASEDPSLSAVDDQDDAGAPAGQSNMALIITITACIILLFLAAGAGFVVYRLLRGKEQPGPAGPSPRQMTVHNPTAGSVQTPPAEPSPLPSPKPTGPPSFANSTIVRSASGHIKTPGRGSRRTSASPDSAGSMSGETPPSLDISRSMPELEVSQPPPTHAAEASPAAAPAEGHMSSRMRGLMRLIPRLLMLTDSQQEEEAEANKETHGSAGKDAGQPAKEGKSSDEAVQEVMVDASQGVLEFSTYLPRQSRRASTGTHTPNEANSVETTVLSTRLRRATRTPRGVPVEGAYQEADDGLSYYSAPPTEPAAVEAANGSSWTEPVAPANPFPQGPTVDTVPSDFMAPDREEGV